jgi:predicted anti-sigma-YlaC factor YlaD
MIDFVPSGVSRSEDDMKCLRIQKKLSRYFDREEPLNPILNQHIQVCPECRRFWDDLSLLEKSLAELKPLKVPGDITIRVMAAIRQPRTTHPFILRPAWAIGMVTVLALVVGFWVGKQWQTPVAIETETATMVEMFSENSPGSLWTFESTNNSQ